MVFIMLNICGVTVGNYDYVVHVILRSTQAVTNVTGKRVNPKRDEDYSVL